MRDSHTQKALDLKHLAGANWVDPPKRERKGRINYSENEFYKASMKVWYGLCNQCEQMIFLCIFMY
jgi:hypothetical protein